MFLDIAYVFRYVANEVIQITTIRVYTDGPAGRRGGERMKKMGILIAVVFGIVLSLRPGVSRASVQDRVTGQEVKKEAAEAAKTTGDYLKQEKEEYEKKIREKLKDFDREAGEWKEKLKDVGKKGRAETEQQLKKLNKKQAEASERLDKLKDKTGRAWKKLKTQMENAMEDLGKEFDKLRSRLKE